MPLDGHSYLVKQGWTGKGNGLRHGSISRPLAIPQKRNLAGLGKDRDEAFPFWDHLFNAAAKSLEIKIRTDDDSSDSDDERTNGDTSAVLELKRTCTGLISNKRPIHGTNASSGTSTPGSDSSSQGFRLSLLAEAKRQAARQGLYARFFRGPVLGPEISEAIKTDITTTPSASRSTTDESAEIIGKKRKRKDKDEEKAAKKKEKERKKKGKERAEVESGSEMTHTKIISISTEESMAVTEIVENGTNGSKSRKVRSEEERLAKKLRKKLREEKRKRKEEKRRLKHIENEKQ